MKGVLLSGRYLFILLSLVPFNSKSSRFVSVTHSRSGNGDLVYSPTGSLRLGQRLHTSSWVSRLSVFPLVTGEVYHDSFYTCSRTRLLQRIRSLWCSLFSSNVWPFFQDLRREQGPLSQPYPYERILLDHVRSHTHFETWPLILPLLQDLSSILLWAFTQVFIYKSRQRIITPRDRSIVLKHTSGKNEIPLFGDGVGPGDGSENLLRMELGRSRTVEVISFFFRNRFGGRWGPTGNWRDQYSQYPWYPMVLVLTRFSEDNRRRIQFVSLRTLIKYFMNMSFHNVLE